MCAIVAPENVVAWIPLKIDSNTDMSLSGLENLKAWRPGWVKVSGKV
jgi:hypothetical protein